ncbi:MAG: MBL fold metallo-hydrolase [Planctomycetota bacterium]
MRLGYFFYAMLALLCCPERLSVAHPTVHILAEGYVQPIEGKEFVPGKTDSGERKVAGTITLVKAEGAVIVADPGMIDSRGRIEAGLRSQGVSPDAVTHVFVSHHHPDHTVNAGMFPKAKVVDFWGEYENDVWRDHGDRYELASGVYVLQTPGHTKQDASLVVETEEGVVVLTHLWWDENMQPAVDPLAEAPKELDQHRLKVLEIADWIIPGHGKKFANPGKKP